MNKIIKGSELKDEKLEVLKSGLLRILNKPKRFIPKVGEIYYFVSTLDEVHNNYWDGDDIDYWQLNNKKLFNDKDDARLYLEYLKRKKELGREFKPGGENYYFELDYRYSCGPLIKIGSTINKIPSMTYFDKDNLNRLYYEFSEEFIKAWEFDYYEGDWCNPYSHRCPEFLRRLDSK